MRIGINTRFLISDQLEGIGWFCFEVFKRWVKNHPEHEFIFFFDRPFSEKFIFADNVKGVVVYPPARAIPLWKIWFNFSLPYYAKKEEIDVLVSPDGYASLKTDIPQLLVIHDLAFEHDSFGLADKYIKYYKKYTPLFAKKAARIATVSNYTKEDVHSRYHIPLDKIDVVYNGYNEEFAPIEDSEKIQIRGKFTSGKPFYLTVGAIHPRKNGLRLLKAFDAFKQKTKSDYKLVFIGRKAWSNREFDDYMDQMSFQDDVIFLGHLSFDELKNILASAEVMFYPSLFEGFGIPILEAFACGVPVVTSNISSMPEVGGDAAHYIDPNSNKDIYESMIKFYNDDDDYKKEMINKTYSQKVKFSWDKSAENLWGSLEKIL